MSTNYAVGHNMAGYLPESDVYVVATFDEAKSILIHDLKFAEDYADDESEAEEYCSAAEDVNLWNVPDTIYVNYRSGYMAYWIMETDEDVSDDDSRYLCDVCGRIGTVDDGISGDGTECPDEDCPGIVHRFDENSITVVNGYQHCPHCGLPAYATSDGFARHRDVIQGPCGLRAWLPELDDDDENGEQS